MMELRIISSAFLLGIYVNGVKAETITSTYDTFTCVKDTKDSPTFPVCPELKTDKWCDGSQPGDCDTDMCTCDIAKTFCETGINPCENTLCNSYITNSSNVDEEFKLTISPPQPMVCTQYEFPKKEINYGDLSCCSNEGYYQMGLIGGGFQFHFVNPTNTTTTTTTSARCEATAHAMSTMICNPDQGKYVEDGALKICLSACTELFNACGLPGDIFMNTMNYNDPKSLCENSWGGTNGALLDVCTIEPDGFPCKSGITSIQVIEDDCLNLILPGDDDIEWYESNDSPRSQPYDNCKNDRVYGSDDSDNRPFSFQFNRMIFPALAFFAIILASLAYRCYKTRKEGNFTSYPGAAAESGQVLEGNGGGSGGVNNTNYNSGVNDNAQSPQAFVDNPDTINNEGKKDDEDIPAAIPVDAKPTDDVTKPTLFDQLNAQLDDKKENSPSTEVIPENLSFVQQLDLRELDDQKKSGRITDEQYERKKNAILYGAA